MASATGIPDQAPTEQEPLLGRAGDASQKEGKSIIFNLFMGQSSVSLEIVLSTSAGLEANLECQHIGTAVLAQAGIWIVGLQS
jgi:hypothetical protein